MGECIKVSGNKFPPKKSLNEQPCKAGKRITTSFISRCQGLEGVQISRRQAPTPTHKWANACRGQSSQIGLGNGPGRKELDIRFMADTKTLNKSPPPPPLQKSFSDGGRVTWYRNFKFRLPFFIGREDLGVRSRKDKSG